MSSGATTTEPTLNSSGESSSSISSPTQVGESLFTLTAASTNVMKLESILPPTKKARKCTSAQADILKAGRELLRKKNETKRALKEAETETKKKTEELERENLELRKKIADDLLLKEQAQNNSLKKIYHETPKIEVEVDNAPIQKYNPPPQKKSTFSSLNYAFV